VEPELPTGADGPVTTTVTRRVKPGHEAAYEQFLAGVSGAARTFPGYLGVEVFRPAPGGHGGEYRTVYRFDSAVHLRAWLDSPQRAAWLQRAEPYVAGPIQTQVLTGLEGWFTLPNPARCPTTPALQDGPGHLGDDLPADHPGGGRHRAAFGAPAAVVRLAVTTGVTVPLMTWVVMPRVTRLLHRWLYPDRRP
jgi:uncharacterized protein